MKPYHGVGNGLQGSLCEIVTAVHLNPMQGVSQNQAERPRPLSSICSRSGRSLSPTISPQYRDTVDGKEWSVVNFIESYQSREDVPNTRNSADRDNVESEVNLEANEANEHALMLLSAGTRSSSPAAIEAEAPNCSLRTIEGSSGRERVEVVRDTNRVERSHNTLHGVKIEGHRGNSHRIERPQYYKGKKKLKQQQNVSQRHHRVITISSK